MRRERLKKLSADVRQHFPPPKVPGKVVIVKILSDRALTDEEIDERAAKILRKPNECRILINVVKVASRRREPAAEDVEVKGTTSPARGVDGEERALEAEVRRLERRKAELIAAGKTEPGKAELERRAERVLKIKRAARNAGDRARRKI